METIQIVIFYCWMQVKLLIQLNIVNYLMFYVLEKYARIRYFMYTYDISIDEWKGSYNNILSKIKHVSLSYSTYDNIVNGMLIRELGMQRDSEILIY